MNLIMGISSYGKFYYSVNLGTTNGDTFFYFLLKLIHLLDTEDLKWREHTVIMLDNAGYHKSQQNMERYREYKVPVMFLGPYHFSLAPVELMFNIVKERNLNPLRSPTTSK